MRYLVRLLWLSSSLLGLGCTVGEGTGTVTSDRLIMRDCWNGPFDLRPTFFAANAFSEDQLSIRIQRGADNMEVSDGLVISVRELQKIRSESLGQPVRVSIPPGVHPPGAAWTTDPEPAVVSLSLYLHDTCYVQNGALYSVAGDITFHRIFSGNADERVGENRLTEAEFDDISFADPRDAKADGSFDSAVVSHVRGRFRFYFQRGQPAQPFP